MIPALALPPEVQEMIRLDPYLAGKYNRARRWREKSDYIDRYIPELKAGGFRVLDIGPGPGEFLELCQDYGNEAIGIDSVEPNVMGDAYDALSRACHKAQGLDVSYIGLSGFLTTDWEGFDCINLQGSLEIAMTPYLRGDGFGEHKRTGSMVLDLDPAAAFLYRAIQGIRKKLNPNGSILLYCNALKNQIDYAGLLENAASGLRLEMSNPDRTLWK